MSYRVVTTGNVSSRKSSSRLSKRNGKGGNGGKRGNGGEKVPRGRRRSGPNVQLAADGLPRPKRPLTTEEQNIRRLVIGQFESNYSALAEAVHLSRGTIAKFCEGAHKRAAVPRYHLEAIAKAARTTVEALRVPHPKGIYAGGEWFLPTHPRYAQMARNLIAANPALDREGFELPA